MPLKRSGWKTSGSRPEPDRIRQTPSGRIQVRDRGYMKALHDRATQPIDPPGFPSGGPLELHHTVNPTGDVPRAFDAGVIPLSRAAHEHIESYPRLEHEYAQLFSEWSALHYWAYRTGQLDHPDPKAFLLWVVKKLKEEADADE